MIFGRYTDSDTFAIPFEAFGSSVKAAGEAFAKAFPPPDPLPTDDPLTAKKKRDEQRRRRLESLNGPKRGPRNIAPTRHR